MGGSKVLTTKIFISIFRVMSIKTLHRYAHIYVDTQQQFHGTYSEKILVGRELQLFGELPYWDLTVNRNELEIIGCLEDSPLLTTAGKLRIFCHYLDFRGKKLLQKKYGVPSGKILGKMTSSGRTVMVFPPNAKPFMLKFSGNFFAPELGFNNVLNYKNILQAIANFNQQKSNPYLTPEPVGIVIPELDFAFLQRALPLLQDKFLELNDVVLGTSVILSTVFAATELGQSIFSIFGGQETWLEQIFAPQIANLIDDTLQRKIAHLELHPQNLDVVINSQTGQIRQLLVKDLEDMYQDPAAFAALNGEYPTALNVTRDRLFGVLGEYHSKYTLDRFYWEFLGQTLGKENLLIQETVAKFLRVKFIHRWSNSHLWDRCQLYPEYRQLMGNGSGDVFDAIALIRDLELKLNLEQNFRSDQTAFGQFINQSGTIVANNKLKAFSFTPTFKHLEFGFVGKVPLAITKDSEEMIQNYYFKFFTT